MLAAKEAVEKSIRSLCDERARQNAAYWMKHKGVNETTLGVEDLKLYLHWDTEKHVWFHQHSLRIEYFYKEGLFIIDALIEMDTKEQWRIIENTYGQWYRDEFIEENIVVRPENTISLFPAPNENEVPSCSRPLQRLLPLEQFDMGDLPHQFCNWKPIVESLFTHL